MVLYYTRSYKNSGIYVNKHVINQAGEYQGVGTKNGLMLNIRGSAATNYI